MDKLFSFTSIAAARPTSLTNCGFQVAASIVVLPAITKKQTAKTVIPAYPSVHCVRFI